jgi:class 3 adenylate cyclase/predicted ATPase
VPGRGYKFTADVKLETTLEEFDKAAPVARHLPGDRRQVTVLSGELLPAAGHVLSEDPEELHALIESFRMFAASVCEQFSGSMGQCAGREVTIFFGYPSALEDAAERGIAAALALAAGPIHVDANRARAVAAGVGIATGLVMVDTSGELIGQALSEAALLRALTQPGQVILAAATRRLIGGLFRLRDLGRQAVLGFAEPVEAWAVEGLAAAETRFEAIHRGLVDLVGRGAECAILRDRLRRAWGGQGQIVLLSGEAGIGKSRLATWLATEVAAEPHTRLRYQCSPYHRGSMLHPFVVQLGRAARIFAEDTPETQLKKLEAILAPARIAETAPLFASLLSIPTGDRYPPLALSAAQQRRLTLAALLDQLEALARQKPVLALLEDAHWADPTSLEVLDLTVERVRGLPVLVLITFRPEYEAPWAGLSHATSITLDRLTAAEVESLATRVAGGRALPREVMAQIVAKTDGVPLFVEELTKAVLESGLLVAGPQGWGLRGPLPPFAIPVTLQDSLTARLDRLAPVKEIAQIGAAIGREFSYPVLRAVAGRDEAALRAALAQLEEAELLLCAGTAPDARYAFKHALVQDAAYETLLKSRRQILHRRIADALRDQFAATAAAEPEVVAYHLTQAGLDEPATEWWGKAGDQAVRRSAFKEAASHFGKAIELADKLAAAASSPSRGISRGNRLRLQISLGNALIWAKGYQAPETSAAFARARELASRVEDPSERFSAYWGLWNGHGTRGEAAPMRDIAELFLREATARPDCPEAPVAHRVSGVTCLYFGDFAAAHEHFQKALALYDWARHGDLTNRFGTDPRANPEVFDAIALWFLGRIDEALPLAGRALADAEASAHIPTMAFVLSYRALLGLFRRHPEAIAADSQALAAIVSEYDLAAILAGLAAFFRGWANWSCAAGEAPLAEMQTGIAIQREHDCLWLLPPQEAALAEAEAVAGEIDAGLKRLEDALAEAKRSGAHWYEAEMHRIRAEILLKRDPADLAPAAQALQTAIAIAQHQKARSLELRAALALAKLYRSTGREGDALAVLAPAVEGFPPTEQFPELTEAQTLEETRFHA